MTTSFTAAPSGADASQETQASSLDDMPLKARLARIEARVRAQPTTATHRWALFQVLCAMEQWARAIQQLQVYAQLSPDQAKTAQAYRDLIRAERWRARVVAGRERPGFVFEPPLWVERLIEALRLSADGQIEAADRVREGALDQAPLVNARTSRNVLDWIADSDTRFGPVCEFVTAGHYRWLPFSDIAAWQIARPSSLIDLVWTPCALTLVDGTTVRGFMPARYPGSEVAGSEVAGSEAAGSEGAGSGQAGAGGRERGDERDALRLGRKTRWREVGRTGVIATGQKTWATSAGDFGLFELDACEFGRSAGIGMTQTAPQGMPAKQDGGDGPA